MHPSGHYNSAETVAFITNACLMASKYVVTPEAVRQIGKLFKRPESVEGLDKFLGVGQDGDGVGLGSLVPGA